MKVIRMTITNITTGVNLGKNLGARVTFLLFFDQMRAAL